MEVYLELEVLEPGRGSHCKWFGCGSDEMKEEWALNYVAEKMLYKGTC